MSSGSQRYLSEREIREMIAEGPKQVEMLQNFFRQKKAEQARSLAADRLPAVPPRRPVCAPRAGPRRSLPDDRLRLSRRAAMRSCIGAASGAATGVWRWSFNGISAPRAD